MVGEDNKVVEDHHRADREEEECQAEVKTVGYHRPGNLEHLEGVRSIGGGRQGVEVERLTRRIRIPQDQNKIKDHR
jgi:hypothetical protein